MANLSDEALGELEHREDFRTRAEEVRAIVAEVRRLRYGDWIERAAEEIAGDPSVKDGGADRIADVIRGHAELE
jgi:hypothetical protein